MDVNITLDVGAIAARAAARAPPSVSSSSSSEPDDVSDSTWEYDDSAPGAPGDPEPVAAQPPAKRTRYE